MKTSIKKTVFSLVVYHRSTRKYVENAPSYFLDGATYCKSAEAEISMPTLFDLQDVSQPEAVMA